MSKNYKVKQKVAPLIEEQEKLSKKEQYDLQKAQKMKMQEKEKKKVSTIKKKKKKKKTYQTNLAGRIFAVIMLILMVGSVIASIAAYIR